MTDPLLTVLVDRWRQTAGRPDASADDAFTTDAVAAYTSGLGPLLGVELDPAEVAACATPRGLAGLLRARRAADRRAETKETGEATAAASRTAPAADWPATDSQAGIWYVCTADEDATAYNSPVMVRCAQRLDPCELRRALRAVVARHESLRTTLDVAADGRVTQHVSPEPRFGFATFAAHDEEEVRRHTAELAAMPMDLRTGPLLHVLCLDAQDAGTVLLVNVHHAVFDGFSWSVLLTEWLTGYQRLTRGEEVGDAPAPAQFREVIATRERRLGPAAEREALAYWSGRLADAPPPLALPLDRPHDPGRGRRAGAVRTVLDAPRAARLRQRAAAEGVTPLMALLSAYALLLHRHTGQDDVTVGLPVSLRDGAAAQQAVGHLVNTVVLRHTLAADDTGHTVLARGRQEVLGALRHKDLAFERVVEAVGPGREGGGPPLFQTMVTMMPRERRSLEHLGLGVEDWRHVTGTPKYDLVLIIEEGDDTFELTFEYDAALFDADTVERVARRFRTLLADLLEHPERPVRELRWIPAEELAELEAVWHGAQDERIGRQPVHVLFEEQARRTPHTVALEAVDGTAVSYRELDADANRLAHALRERGAGPGTRVAIRLERGVEAVTTLLAVLKAGASFVPLDPAYPAERTALMLADSRPRLLVARGRPEGTGPKGPELFDLAAESGRLHRQPDTAPDVTREPGAEMYVVYTSGSTGRPKGVVINDPTITNLAYRQRELSGPHADARTLQYMSLSFDVSFEEIFGTLCAGGTLVLTDEEMRADLHRLAVYLRERRVARLFLPYVALQELASVVVRVGLTLPELAEVYTTGEQLVVTPQLREMFADRTGAALLNVYGPSEAHLCTAYRLSGDPASWPRTPPIGHVVGGVRLYVLDADRRPVPFGVPGELYVGGPVVSPGYLQLPEQTRERFLPDPYADTPGARFYRTGDLVRCRPREGFTHLGRLDEQIKIRGHRIEPAEVEAALNALPEVTASAVVAVEHGAGDRRLVAFLCTRPEPAGAFGAELDGVGLDQGVLDEVELRRQLARVLPAHLVPSRFVRLDRLPTGPSGKADRAALARRAAQLPAPVRQAAKPRGMSATEQEVAAVWQELLEVPAIGAEDDFFAQGGHSLLAVRLRQALQDAYGVPLPLGTLLAVPTVAGMAARVEQALTGQTSDTGGPDLWADTRLPDGLDPAHARTPADPLAPREVLLTGVTGFLGVYLLRSLLERGCVVHALVRAASTQEALRRITETARAYRALDGLDLTRVRAVPGDLSRPRFGLSPQAYRELAGRVEAVYHSAAHINFAAPYVSVRPTNVDGFVRVVEFCADTVLKPLHHMSTLAVFPPGSSGQVIDEDSEPGSPRGLGIGYAQSKWVAERLALGARERGVPVTVHRIGRIGPDTATGACRTDDFFWLQVKSFLRLGLAPQEPGPPVDLLPVDVVADAVVRLSRSPAAYNRTVHVFHPVGMDWETVLEAVGTVAGRPRTVPVQEWLTALESAPAEAGGHSLASLVPLFREGAMELGDHRYTNDTTVALLKDLGLELPAADPSWITAMIRYFTEMGQIAAADRP
ncbi:amino acid adenylation domain-containing protein [Streptomyces sp. JJ66]|uniref:non-ribosomal peptide synthetase family protein n=1 Tax=Streptomyces sp. JJ66 TaxID=2803843 RepID=UPI001C559AD1|nr:non-ribosomal peptide synthetase [Streptomyces sp. JJ66]MBW1600591.1 amino acid adenylation domain-containing protein [Streptomyces sp. JJ66]